MAVIINASTSTGLVQSADTSGIIQFQSNGSTKATLNSSGFSYPGAVLQVISTTKTDTTSFVSSSTNTFVDITGMSVTITPKSANNKILVMYTAGVSNTANATIHLRLIRGSTSIGQGNAESNRLGASLTWRPVGSTYNFDIGPLSSSFLDSPNTTSATTYKLMATLGSSYSGTFYLNRPWDNTDADYSGRSASTITVMEIAV
jgi:hypothetical protein